MTDLIREGFADINTKRLHYVEIGDGQPVVFLHGDNGFLQDFSFGLLREFPRGYRGFAIDRPGYGQSDPLEKGAPLGSHLEYLRLFIDYFSLVRPILVGHSWGGALVLAYALKFPGEIMGVMHLSGAAYPEANKVRQRRHIGKNRFYGLLYAMALNIPYFGWRNMKKSVFKAFFPALPPIEYLEVVKSIWPNFSQIMTAIYELSALEFFLVSQKNEYKNIRLPVVIVVGDSDKILDIRQEGIRLYRDVISSHLHVLKNAGHDLHLSHSSQVISLLKEHFPSEYS